MRSATQNVEKTNEELAFWLAPRLFNLNTVQLD